MSLKEKCENINNNRKDCGCGVAKSFCSFLRFVGVGEDRKLLFYGRGDTEG